MVESLSAATAGRRGAPAAPPPPRLGVAASADERALRLRWLAAAARHAVVAATMATELDAKVRWWAAYRQARTEALTLLGEDGRLLRVVRG